jgi:hypothetical protein
MVYGIDIKKQNGKEPMGNSIKCPLKELPQNERILLG